METGLLLSSRTSDDRWRADNMPYPPPPNNPLYKQELIDFYTLKYDNAFGNRLRFTDINGNFTVTDDPTIIPNLTYRYIIDHLTGLGISHQITYIPNNITWNTAIDDSLSLSLYGFDDYYLPNINELYSLVDFEGSFYNIGITWCAGNRIQWSSTTYKPNTANAWYLFTLGSSSNTIKANANRNYFPIRQHY